MRPERILAVVAFHPNDSTVPGVYAQRAPIAAIHMASANNDTLKLVRGGRVRHVRIAQQAGSGQGCHASKKSAPLEKFSPIHAAFRTIKC
jgi:hypothetical protein